MSHGEQYALIEVSQKKWPKITCDLNYNEYELPILKYDANENALVAKKEGNPMEEKWEMKTPSTSKFENGEDFKNTYEKSCGSCNRITVESQNWEETKLLSYVQDHMHWYKWEPS